ncbi:MAG: phosphoribosyl-AMP cyclohydrolase [bacterium]|nr:phosphoribosyl-AMP cyclohydrolase [bacterium]
MTRRFNMEPIFRRIMFYYDRAPGIVYMELIIVNIFDAKTKEHLMTAHMDLCAWRKTKETRIVHLRSTSRNELWRKGATSGNEMKVISMWLDCDYDAVDIYVEIQGNGVACHTGQKSCFFNEVS